VNVYAVIGVGSMQTCGVHCNFVQSDALEGCLPCAVFWPLPGERRQPRASIAQWTPQFCMLSSVTSLTRHTNFPTSSPSSREPKPTVAGTNPTVLHAPAGTLACSASTCLRTDLGQHMCRVDVYASADTTRDHMSIRCLRAPSSIIRPFWTRGVSRELVRWKRPCVVRSAILRLKAATIRAPGPAGQPTNALARL
jgi:hypothetical protein